MNSQAEDVFEDSAITRLTKWSETPVSGMRIATRIGNASNVGEQPILDLTREFEHDLFESAQALLILIDLPGVPPENVSIALGNDALHVQVCVEAAPTCVRTPAPGAYAARFDVAASTEAESIDVIIDNGLLKIRVAKQSRQEARIEIATSDDELLWIA